MPYIYFYSKCKEFIYKVKLKYYMCVCCVCRCVKNFYDRDDLETLRRTFQGALICKVFNWSHS